MTARDDLLTFARRVDSKATVTAWDERGHGPRVVEVTLRSAGKTFRLKSSHDAAAEERACGALLLQLQLAYSSLVPRRTIRVFDNGRPWWLEDYVAHHKEAG